MLKMAFSNAIAMPAIFQFEYDFKWQSSVFSTISIDSIRFKKNYSKLNKWDLFDLVVVTTQYWCLSNMLECIYLKPIKWNKNISLKWEINFYFKPCEEWQVVMKNTTQIIWSIWLLVKRPLFAWASTKIISKIHIILYMLWCVWIVIRVHCTIVA